MNSDKSVTKSGFVGRYLTVLDLKMSCRLVCAVDQDNLSELAHTSTNEELSWESHEQASFPTRQRSKMTSNLNMVSHNRKSVSVQQADVPTNFNRFDPTKNLQFYNKQSAIVWQSLFWEKTFFHLYCLGLPSGFPNKQRESVKKKNRNRKGWPGEEQCPSTHLMINLTHNTFSKTLKE